MSINFREKPVYLDIHINNTFTLTHNLCFLFKTPSGSPVVAIGNVLSFLASKSKKKLGYVVQSYKCPHLKLTFFAILIKIRVGMTHRPVLTQFCTTF